MEEKTNENRLRIKGPVDEGIFFQHLDNVCKDDKLKGFIKEFYNNLIEADKKSGLTISAKTFGETKTFFVKGKKIDYDFNKYLFAHGEVIGRADFFRYQFVNLIDKVIFYDYDEEETRDGFYNPNFKSINIKNSTLASNEAIKQNKFKAETLLDRQVSLNEYNKHYFTPDDIENLQNQHQKRIVFHELTHMFSTKTYEDGKIVQVFNNDYINDLEKKRLVTKVYPFIYKYKEIFEIFNKGRDILCEMFTEVYANKHQKYFTNTNRKFLYSSPKVLVDKFFAEKDKFLYLTCGYTPISYIMFLINPEYYFTTKKYLFNPKLIEEDINNVELSAEAKHILARTLGRYFAKKTNAKDPQKFISQFENSIKTQTPNYHSFLLLLGIVFDHSEQDVSKLYNEYGKLLQAIIFDARTQHLKKILKQNTTATINNANQEVDQQKKIDIPEFLQKEIKIAERIQKYVIKSRHSVQTPGFNSRVVKPSDVLSEHDFARNEAKEEFNIKMWDNYLQHLIKFCNQIDPELIDNSEFLTREQKAIQKEEQFQKELEGLKK